jgi:hypothetical protein
MAGNALGTLFAGICGLGLAIFGFIQMEQLAAFNTSAQLALGSEKIAENIGIVMDARISLLRVELRMGIEIIIAGSSGLLLLIVTLYGWNRQGLHASLKASLLEAALEKEGVPRKDS